MRDTRAAGRALVLDGLDATEARFSQGVLVSFRGRLIAHDLDRRLLTRTIDLAKRTGKFGWQRLQAALDSSPLLGAGRIEDTWNLIGRALGAVVTCAAKAVDRPRDAVIADAGLTLVDRSSLKAALDIEWDDPAAKAAALERLLADVDRVERWVAVQLATIEATPALHNLQRLARLGNGMSLRIQLSSAVRMPATARRLAA